MLQRGIRRAIALTASLSFASATLMGALAYDLSQYPGPFVNNGVFTGKIVVGEHAEVADVLGAIEIAANLQSISTTKSGISNAAYLTGDVKNINGGKLLLRKKVATTLTGKDLKGLAGGPVVNSRGATDYAQYLRFGSSGFNPLTVNYELNDDDQLESFAVLEGGAPFMEWELQFTDGLESQRDSDGRLRDLEDKTIALAGEPATIVEATIAADGTDLQLTLMSGSVGDTMREGETKTYTIGDKTYEVTLAFVSDPNAAGGANEAKFLVNGEMTHALEEGETDKVDDTQLGVRDILVNSREGVASFYLGAKDVRLTDPTPTTEDFDGSVEINSESLNEGQYQAVGYFQNENATYRIAWMKYRFEADPADGSTLYLSDKDHTLREKLDNPEGFLSGINIHYHGLLPVTHKDVNITNEGDDAYRLSFSNVEGKSYEVPLLTNKDGVWKYGDEDDDFIFVEGTSLADYNVGMNDYVLLSNAKSGNDADKSVTHVFQYTEYDPSNLVVTFESMSDHTATKVALAQSGIGYLFVGSNTFKFNVSDVTAREPLLSVDLDGDGGFSDETKVVAYGGVIINLAQTVYRNESLNVTLSDATITDIVGNGKNISGVTGFADGDGFVQMNALTLAKKFDTPSTDETFNWTLRQAPSDEVDLDMSATEFDGPLNTDTSNVNYGFHFESPDDDDDHTRGLTDWGTLIDLNAPNRHPAELSLSIPQTLQYTQLFITIGNVRHDAPPATSEKVNPIAVGIAVTDAKAPALGTENMIVVGGPCANTVAAALVGTTPDACARGFTPGESMIRAFEQDGKVALLVAGYDGVTTQGAARALAQYASKGFSGEKVELVVTDVEHVTVKET